MSSENQAPKVTIEQIEGLIVSEVYITGSDICDAIAHGHAKNGSIKSEYREGEQILAPLDNLTICLLVLRNGFTVRGESACVSASNFDVELGRKNAREDAIKKIWMLEGYLLTNKLHDEKPVTQFISEVRVPILAKVQDASMGADEPWHDDEIKPWMGEIKSSNVAYGQTDGIYPSNTKIDMINSLNHIVQGKQTPLDLRKVAIDKLIKIIENI